MKKSDNLLEVNNLTVLLETPKGFVRAVDDVSFSLKNNSILSIIGESGSGKTVLLSSICGILRGDPGIVEGSIKFKDNELLGSLSKCVKVKNNSKRLVVRKNEYQYSRMLKKIRQTVRSEIAMIFQDPRKSLDPLFTIEEQLYEAFSLKIGDSINSQQYSEIKDQMLDWLEKVKIFNPGKVLKQYPPELSGGMLQRVMIAMSMIIEPDLIIADEPTTALDVNTTIHVIDILLKLYETISASILFVTHDISLAEKFSDEIIIMNSGQIVEYGNNNSIFNNHYKHPYTNALFKSRLNPLTTNQGTPVHFIKDRSADEIYLQNGCKFRQRCDFADESCALSNDKMIISNNHWIFCKNLYERVYNEK